MKKAIVFILSALVLLTSCSTKEDNKKSVLSSGYETARECNMYSNLTLNGMLFSESFDGSDFVLPRTYFYDFDTMTSALLCSKPNCKHDDPETCTAFGMADCGVPVAVGKNLFFFDWEMEWADDGELLAKMNIVRSELDGSSRKTVATINKADYIYHVFVKNEMLYFIIQEEHHELHTGASNDYRKSYLYSFDTKKEKCTNCGLLSEGFSNSASICGEYNGGLYLSASYRENEFWYLNPDGSEKSIQELSDLSDVITKRYRFDMNSGELSDWDMPLSTLNEYDRMKPMFIIGGYYGYMDGEDAHILDSEGNEMVLEGYSLSGSTTSIPINGYYFNINGDNNGKSAYTAVELSTGKILKVNKKAVPKWHFVLTYHNGSYIIYDEMGSGEFKKVSPDEIFEVEE